MTERVSNIRNVAIIAHVDHGKTTLVDALLTQSGTISRKNGGDLIMDSMELERERGITIASKNCTMKWENLTINIIDTPGHSDFGGEVERILSMADGALLLVDAAEGPLPQTRFVLKKALEAGLEIVVVVNKIDRSDARPSEVVDEIFSLFIDCGANDKHLEASVLYAVARDGKASRELDGQMSDITPIFEAIRDHIPGPPVDEDAPLSMLIANLDYSEYVGRLAIGRIQSGRMNINQNVLIAGDGREYKGKITHIYGYDGLKRIELDSAGAGQIVAVSGIEEITIGDTITDIESPKIQPRIKVEEPTVTMVFAPNTSPMAGREGKFVTARQIRDRLYREEMKNVSIRVEQGDSPDRFLVAGRGELQLAILIETMRREGYEMEVGRPHVIEKTIDGERSEPFEVVVLDIPEEFIGVVTELFSSRRGIIEAMHHIGSGRIRMDFRIPSRGLIGIRSTFLTETRGTGIMHAIFDSYGPYSGRIGSRINGAIVSDRTCKATSYAIKNIEDRGVLFVAPGEDTYQGMIVGEHCKENDIEVYIGRPKKLTNMRASTADEAIVLAPPRKHTLESAMEWINDNELIEITPVSIRLRKLFLDPSLRKDELRIKRVEV